MLDTFVASMKSVGTAVSMASVGIYLHQRGFIGASDKRTLAVISQQVTFPLFLFTTILNCKQDYSIEKCPDVTETLKSAWLLVLWPVFVVGAGLIVGHITSRWTDTPKAQHRSVMAAMAFGNSTGLPITLLTVVHSNFPTTSGLGLVDPTLFLSVYLLLYPVLQWGLGGWLLAPDDIPTKEKSVVDEEAVEKVDSSEGDESARGQTYYSTITKNLLNQPNAENYFHERVLSSSDEGIYLSQNNLVGIYSAYATQDGDNISDGSATTSVNESLGIDYTQEMTEDQPLLVGQSLQTASYQSSSQQKTSSEMSREVAIMEETDDSERSTNQQSELMHTLKNIAERSLQPPVVGALLGIFFSVIRPLRGSLVDVVDRDGSAPLEFAFDGLFSIGKAAVPINMMILGCNLSNSYNQYTGKTERSGKGGLFTNATMIGVVLGKMVVLPVIGILTTILFRKFILDIPEEMAPSFYLVMMIVFLTPTGNNVIVMVELSGCDTKEGIASAIAMQYCLAPVLLTFTVSFAISVATQS